MTQNWKPIEYKFILLGDSSVGKSAIFSRLSGKPFSGKYVSIIGTEKILIDFDNVPIETDFCQNFRILLFDTAGQERYKAITKNYFRDSQGIVLIYSIENETSFEHIQTWLDSIKDSLSDWEKSGYIVMLLGNKLDIAEENAAKRMILIEEAERVCKEQNIYWGGECSAKTFDEEQIREIFIKFIKQIYLKLRDKANDKNKNIKQNKKQLTHYEKRKNKECCLMKENKAKEPKKK